MTTRPSTIGLGLWLATAPALAALVATACSSEEGLQLGPGEVVEDAGAQAEAATGDGARDGGTDAETDAETVPPYDFAVKCAQPSCVTGIAARGGSHACAVLQDGSVRCWGSNASGQLGTGRDDAGVMPAFATTPREVVGLTGATGVVATGSGRFGTSCVLSGIGDVTCFGSNEWAQLGRGLAASSGPNPDPAPVAGGLKAKAVALTNTFALAIGTDDALWSWGANDSRQLARATTGADAGSPAVPARGETVDGRVKACAGTTQTGFVVSEGRALLSWGGGTAEQLGRASSLARDPIPAALAISDVSRIATGNAHACALHRGQVDCWGKNEHGQLGTSRKADELLPARVALPAGVYAVDIAAGGDSSCIIAANGDVYCWGANGSAQVGAPAGADQPTARRIEGLTEATVAIAVMSEAVCALLRSGSVACWGSNAVGQLGRGTRDGELHVEPGPVVFE